MSKKKKENKNKNNSNNKNNNSERPDTNTAKSQGMLLLQDFVEMATYLISLAAFITS